jgi:hypothetical protein
MAETIQSRASDMILDLCFFKSLNSFRAVGLILRAGLCGQSVQLIWSQAHVASEVVVALCSKLRIPIEGLQISEKNLNKISQTHEMTAVHFECQ